MTRSLPHIDSVDGLEAPTGTEIVNITTADPTDTPMTDASTTPARTGRRSWWWVLAAGLLAVAVVVGVVVQHDSVTGLIGVGPASPAYPVVHHDLPDAVEFTGTGLDGALFYAIARSPFDVHRAARSLDYPTYRLRRILYPALGWAIAPSGGAPLIWALAGISIAGVVLGAWALSRFPGAPPWLPLAMVINPGVILALSLTLSDALATGLVLAAFAAMFRRRTAVAVALLVLACLTRETSYVAALSLAFWPGLTRPRRAALAVVPAVPLGLWSLFVAHTLGEPLLQQNGGGTFSLPLVGWARSGAGAADVLVGLLAVGLIGAALTRWRRTPLPVTIYLAVTLVMVICSAPIIAQTWFGTGRVIAVAYPLAIWVLARRPSRTRLRAA